MKKSVLEKEKILLIFMFALGIIKLLMVTNIPIIAQPDAKFDDGLMLNQADSLANLGWLGAYSEVTLVKGPFFPFFLAVCKWIGLPYLDAQTIFYMLGCIFFTFACRDLFKTQKPLYVLYFILLFNPVTYSSETFQRVYRNGIVMAQELFILGAMIAVFLKVYEPVKKWIPWVIGGSVGFVTMWYTREDSIWILPFVLTASIIIFAMIVKKEGVRNRKTWKKAIVLLCPFMLLFFASTLISGINYKLYGVYAVVDTSGTNFAKAIKTIYSVEDEENIPFVSVSRKKLEELYRVSPTLAQIREILDSSLNYWEGGGRKPGDGEVEDGWFYWALRSSVSKAGFYSDGQTSEEFYRKVTEEIRTAIDNGTLQIRSTMPSALMSPWRKGYGKQLWETMGYTNKFVTGFTGLGIGGSNVISTAGDRQRIELMETMTNERAIYTTLPDVAFSGWIAWKDESKEISLRVVADNEVISDDLVSSTDVVGNDKKTKYFYFNTVLEEITLESGALLQVRDSERTVLAEIPLDGSVRNAETDEYACSFDVLSSYNTTQENYKKSADKYVARLYVFVHAYEKLGTIVYYVAIICFILLIGEVIIGIRKKQYDGVPALLISSGLILSYILFIGGVSYTHISAFPSIAFMYLSNAYPMVLSIEGILILRLLEKAAIFARNKRNARKKPAKIR